MPEDTQSPMAQPGCAPTNGSEVPTPRTDKETWTTIAGAFKCSGANGDLEGEGEYVPTTFARRLERELSALAESHRELVHENEELKNELDWAKQTAADALRERDAARTRAKDYFDALELAAKERDELASRLAGLPND